MNDNKAMKTVDVIVWVLLVIGGLNWGLVGIFGFNLVSFLFGEFTILSRIVYILVGLSAVYELAGIKAILKRWHLQYGSTGTTAHPV